MSRIGVFGGSFDPPHLGHLIVAQDAWAALGLDRVVFMPAALPPHKHERELAPGELRMAMVRAAIAGDARFEVSDLELRRTGPSYTVDTLRELRATDPTAVYCFLLGADQFRDLARWREPAEIARLARLIVLSRGGEEDIAGSEIPHQALPVTRIDISATEIRRRVGAGEPIRYLVAPAVEEIVRGAGLYR